MARWSTPPALAVPVQRDGHPRILSHANGQVPAEIMLVGEAPGRLGASITGIPFSSDVSGQRLDFLLAAAGWNRADVFITNAVLYGPIDARGRNRAPTRQEIHRCSAWLQRQISLVDPMLVIGLGAVALLALRCAHPHDLVVADASDTPSRWDHRWLAAAYHPGARATIHRPVPTQIADFRRLGAWFTALSAETSASR